MANDETLLGISEKVKNFAVICESPFEPLAAVLMQGVFCRAEGG